MPISMNVNEFLGSITNLVVNTRVLQTLSDTVRPIVKSFIKEASPFGDQDRFLTADILDDGDYVETSSLLTVKKPTTHEETIPLSDQKKWKVSLTKYLLQGAFGNEYAISEFYNLLVSMLTKTKNVFLYNKAIGAIMTWAPTKTTQVIKIPVKSTDDDAARAKAIYLALKEIYLNMQAPNTIYNDIGFTEDTMLEDLNMYSNANFENLLEVATNAYAYNLSELTKWLGERKFLIPSHYVNEANENTVGWIWHRDKYQIRPFFDVATSFFDPDNLITHHYIHSWFKSGYLQSLSGVKLVLDVESESYTVTYNSNGGTAVTAATVASGAKATAPTNPTKSGNTFGGWYTNAALTQEYDFNSVVTSDFTLYAKWIAN